MNKPHISQFFVTAGYQDCFAPARKYRPVQEKDNFENILNSIYTVDKSTGAPIGDIAVFLSKNTSPEVKQFIQMNLMSPVKSVGQVTGLSDDDILSMQRQPGESKFDYVQRLYDTIKSAQSEPAND